MKRFKKACAGILLLTMSMTCAAPAFADSGNTGVMGVHIGKNNFPDDAFRAYVSSDIDTDHSGVLSKAEIDAVTTLDLDALDIESLAGLEYFTALTDLSCTDNKLTALSTEKNTALTTLNCANNQLRRLDVSKNTALTSLDASGNQLTGLDLRANKSLTTLKCDDNSHDIVLSKDRTFDLRDLPGGFDPSKSFGWEGGSVTDGRLTAYEGTAVLNYSYDCGNGHVILFTLRVKEGEIAPSGIFTITFDAAGGTVSPSSATTTEGKLTTLPTPRRDGYRFTGWQDKDGKVVNTDTVYEADTTLVAQWTKDAPSTNPFYDVSTLDWFYNDVQFVYDQGLIGGIAPNTFAPYMPTTRGMIVTILHRMEGSPDISGENLGYPFSDVAPDAYYTTAIYWARNHHIVSGYDANRFGPNDAITREQLAAILYNYSTYKKYDTTDSNDLSAFPDASMVNPWAKAPVQWAVGSSLIGGKGNGNLDPQGTATRAEVAAILHRYSRSMD